MVAMHIFVLRIMITLVPPSRCGGILKFYLHAIANSGKACALPYWFLYPSICIPFVNPFLFHPFFFVTIIALD